MNLTSTRSFHLILFWYIDIDRKNPLIDIFQLSTIHFSILYYFYNTTHIHTQICTDVHIRYVLFFSMLAFICIYIWITLAYKNIHTHTHNIILSRCLFFCCFVVVFIEMTILYTMIIVNSHLLHHFIPGPMIQELHIRWFLCIFDLIWFLIGGWDEICLSIWW